MPSRAGGDVDMDVAGPAARIERPATRARRRPRGVAGWAMRLVALAALSTAAIAAFTAQSFFTVDDFLNFGLARELGFGWEYLTKGIYQHLAPGHRALDWLVVETTHLGWWLALALALVGVAASVVLFGALVRECTGSERLALAAAAFFALSVVWVRVVQWWANAAHFVPAMAFTLLALLGVAQWARAPSTRSLVLAGAGFAAALAFYSKAILLPLYACGLLYLALPGAPDVRELPRRIRRDLPLLSVLGVVALAYLVVLRVGGYYEGSPSASAEQWNGYLKAAWLRGIAPLLLNATVPLDAGTFDEVLVVAAQAMILGLVALTLWRHPRAWRAWAFLGLSLAANVILIGAGRLGQFGITIGYDLRYFGEAAFLLPLAVALAFSARNGRRPGRPLPHLDRRWAIPAVVAFGACFIALGARSAERVADAWTGPEVRAYVMRMQESLARLKAQDAAPTVLEGQPPEGIVQSFVVPYNRFSTVVPLAVDGVPVDGPVGTPVVVQADGLARRPRLESVRGGELSLLVRQGRVTLTGGAPGGCLDAGAAPAAVDIAVTDIAGPEPRERLLDVALDRVRRPGSASVFMDVGAGYGALADRRLPVRMGQPRLRTALPPGVARVKIELQDRSAACLGGVRLAAFT